jgi:hypothetical protein
VTIQLDDNNRVYVGGATGSNNFPLANPYQPSKNNGADGFLTIFNPDWQSLAYSTFIGGNQGDTVQSIALDDFGRILALGYSYSTNFPLTNPLQSTNHGSTDVFVTAFEANGQSLFYSTYLGSDLSDVGYSIALDNNGLVYIGGVTWSDNFPVVNPYQPEITGYVDGFVSILGADGQSLQYSTYLGGAYPATTDVSLSHLTGTSPENTNANSSWLWLAFGLSLFFLASLIIGRIVGQRKIGQQK